MTFLPVQQHAKIPNKVVLAPSERANQYLTSGKVTIKWCYIISIKVAIKVARVSHCAVIQSTVSHHPIVELRGRTNSEFECFFVVLQYFLLFPRIGNHI